MVKNTESSRSKSIEDQEHFHDVEMAVGSRKFLVLLSVFVSGLLVGGILTLLVPSYSEFQARRSQSQNNLHTNHFAPPRKQTTSDRVTIGTDNSVTVVPNTVVTFTRKKELMDRPSDGNQQYWDELTPVGHGFVNISFPERYDLLPGIPTESGVDRYSVAMYHQLHCLVRQSS